MSGLDTQLRTFVVVMAVAAQGCISTRAAETPPMRTPAEALDAPLTAEIRAISLLEMASRLSRAEGVNVCIDDKALADAGTSSAQIGPLEISGVTLRSALCAVLHPYDLKFIEQHDVLLITTSDRAESEQIWRIHPVHDLVTTDQYRTYYDSLIELVSTMVEPQSWPAHTGPGPIDGVWDCLIFEQTSDVHDVVAQLLTALRTAKNRESWRSESIRVGSAIALRFSNDVNARLNTLTDLDVDDIPLTDFANLLRTRFELPVRFDTMPMDDSHPEPSRLRVTLSVRQIPLRSAIELALQPLELTTFCESEQLWITTAEAGEIQTRLEIYPVADLIANGLSNDLEAQVSMHVLPETWCTRGGPSCLATYMPLKCLVVSQTDRGHAEVARFLAEVRKLPATRRVKRPQAID